MNKLKTLIYYCNSQGIHHKNIYHMTTGLKKNHFILLLAVVLTIATQGLGQQPVLKINSGHFDAVLSINYSPDGKYIVTGGADKYVRIWDAASGIEIKSYTDKDLQNVNQVLFSPDGKKILFSGGKLFLWDFIADKILKTFEPEKVNSFSFSPDGSRIAVAGKGINIFNAMLGTEVNKIDVYCKYYSCDIFSVSYSPDNKKIAFGGSDSVVYVYEIPNPKPLFKLRGHKSEIAAVAFSPDGKTIVSGGKDKRIRFWDALTGNLLKESIGHSDPVITVAYSRDGKTLMSADGGNIILWNSSSKTESKIFRNPSGCQSVAFSPDGNSLIAGNRDKSIKFWNIATGKVEKSFNGFLSSITALEISADRNKIVFGGTDKSVQCLDLTTAKDIVSFREEYTTKNVCMSPDMNHVLSRNDLGDVRLWDIKTRKNVYKISNYFYGNGLDISSDGKTCVYVDDDDVVVANLITGEKITTFTIDQEDFWITKFTPDGKKIVAAGGYPDYNLYLWEIKSGKQLVKYKGYSACNAIAFDPDGSSFATIQNERVQIYSLKKGEPIENLSFEYMLNSMAYSADGKFLLLGDFNKIISLYDIKNKAKVKTFTGHGSEITAIRFLGNDKMFVSASTDATLKFWNIETGNCIATFYSFASGKDWVVTTSDGRFDASEGGMKFLNYVKGMEIIPLESLFEQFYTPNLLSRLLKGEKFPVTEFNIASIALPPIVKIVSPSNSSTSATATITVSVQVTDQGGGIDEIRLFHNGKLIDGTQRGFKPLIKSGAMETKTFTVTLLGGENIFQASAFSSQRIESLNDKITIFYNGAQSTSNLHLLVIGINAYKNSKYNLNYALPDAKAILDAISAGGKSIFANMNTYFLQDEKASKQEIINTFNEIIAKANAQDVFIFYYAGHGVMSEGSASVKPEFYLVPFDVTTLYGDDVQLASKALSSKELMDFSFKIKAQKQLFLLDACQSGGALQTFASRGAAEEKAVLQLARSTGIALMAASGTEQFATEFQQIGHGVFTYSIIQGLKGKADGGSKDRKITVNELKAFIDDQIPELTLKYKGQAQYPQCIIKGMDFPVVISE